MDSVSCITHPRDWSFLATVASVRTPRVVAQAISRLEGAEPREMTLQDWRAYLLRLLDCADGRDWHDMWEHIAPGTTRRRNSWSGLCSWARRLQLLSKLEDGQEPAEEGGESCASDAASCAISSCRRRRATRHWRDSSDCALLDGHPSSR